MCKTESEHTTEKSERERELASPPLLPQTRATEKSERERERERCNRREPTTLSVFTFVWGVNF
jgi:hypothetical protein